jgi:hypothetical protein
MLIARRPGVNFADAKLTPCGRNKYNSLYGSSTDILYSRLVDSTAVLNLDSTAHSATVTLASAGRAAGRAEKCDRMEPQCVFAPISRHLPKS